MAIGQELLDIPFADMVRNLASAVAEGQFALDQGSIETLKFLVDEKNAIELIPEIAEIIEKTSRTVKTTTPAGEETVTVDGVALRADPGKPVKTTLLQAGILPTFYQFTEALIEVKLSITMKRTEESDIEGRPGFLKRRVMAFGSTVNYRTANTYSYTAQGSSLLRITMKPVPAPARLLPDIVTINTLTTPPTVLRTER